MEKYFLVEVNIDFVAVVNQAWKRTAVDVLPRVGDGNSPLA